MKEIFKKLKMTKKGIDNMNLRNLEKIHGMNFRMQYSRHTKKPIPAIM